MSLLIATEMNLASFRVDFQRLPIDFLIIILSTRVSLVGRPDRGLSSVELPNSFLLFQFQMVLAVTPKVLAICSWLILDSTCQLHVVGFQFWNFGHYNLGITSVLRLLALRVLRTLRIRTRAFGPRRWGITI